MHDAEPGTEISGSYTLHFTAVAAAVGDEPYPPPAATPPSLARDTRLDVRRAADGTWAATATGRWGTPTALTVERTSEGLRLTGDSAVSDGGGAADHWKDIVLPMQDGAFTGAMHATGTEAVIQGDVGWSGDLTGSGSFTRDDVAPEVRWQAFGTVADDVFLPWDPIDVRAAEPVALPTGAVRVTTTSADDHVIASTSADAGSTTFTGTMPAWRTGDATLTVTATSVRDANDNRLAADFTQAFSFVALPSTQSALDVVTAPAGATFWGDHEVVASGSGLCEDDTCLQLGPALDSGCSVPRAGFAARLHPAGTHLALRYRALLAPENAGQSVFFYGPLVTLEAATPGAAPVRQSARADQPLTELEAPIAEYTHGTAWTTLELDLPAAANEVGVAVYLGDRNAIHGGCGGPPAPRSKVVVLVESLGE